MDVVILCGGKGTRLSEETIIKPKPMVEVGSIPILLHIMKIYSHYGHKRFILALGYKGEYIKKYFYNYRIVKNDMNISLDPDVPINYITDNNDNWDITLVDTGQNSLKSERIRRVKDHIQTDSFHLTYGDGVADINLNELVDFHEAHNQLGTVSAVHPPSRFGQLLLHNENFVKKFEEKSQMNREYINGGFFVFHKKIFNYLNNDKIDFEFGALKKLTQDGQLRAFRHEGFWQCMDSLKERNYLNELVDTDQAKWMVWKEKSNV